MTPRHAPGPIVVGLASCVVVVAACRGGVDRTVSPQAEQRPPAVVADASALAQFDADATADTSATRSNEGGPRNYRADIPGVELVRLELGHEPTPDHPRGTLVALGYAGDGTAWLVEVDVARGDAFGRHEVSARSKSRIEMKRVGDVLHLAVQDDGALAWVTYDLSLSETRRITLAGLGKPELRDGYSGFVIVDGRPVLVSNDAVAYVFDDGGKLVARHECRPLLFIANARASVAYANGDTTADTSGSDSTGSEAAGSDPPASNDPTPTETGN